MKKKWCFICSLWLMLFAFGANAADVKEVESEGVKAWMIEDNFLPIVSVQITFKNAGYSQESAANSGLAYFVSGMLNEGAGKYSSQQFQKALEENAIGLSFDVDEDNFYISIKTLKENLPKALELTNLAMTSASFEPEALERVRSQILTIIKKNSEDAGDVAGKEFKKAIYQNHPYSNPLEGDPNVIKNLSAIELRAFTKSHLAKDNVVVSIVGDVNKNEAQDIISKLFQNLPDKASYAEIDRMDNFPKGAVIQKKMAIPQTYVYFGQQGIKRSDKDYFAAYLLNHILGGDGFQSRLVSEVREKNGLAYYVGTSLKNSDNADILVGVVSTKNESVDKSIAIIKEEFKKLAENGVSEKELEDAKSYLTGSFGLNLDKNEKLAGYLTMMQLQNLGRDYLQKRNELLKSVTIDQVNKMAKRLIQPDSLIFVRVGM